MNTFGVYVLVHPADVAQRHPANLTVTARAINRNFAIIISAPDRVPGFRALRREHTCPRMLINAPKIRTK